MAGCAGKEKNNIYLYSLIIPTYKGAELMDTEAIKRLLAEKKVPVIAAFFILLIAAASFLFFLQQEKKSVIDVYVYDSAERPVANAEVAVAETGLTAATDEKGAARLEVERGKGYTLTVKKSGFEDWEDYFDAVEERMEISAGLEAMVIVPATQTISFSDAAGRIITGKELTVKLSCSAHGKEFLPEEEEITTTSGRISVTPPAGCGLIRVIVNGSGFREKSTTVYGSDAIKLEALESPRGTVKITVKTAEGEELPETIKVNVYSEATIVDTSGTGYGGIAVFSLPAGSYYAVVEDEAGNYGAEQADFTVREKKITTKEIVLTREVRLRLSVEVTDETSGAVVEDADVVLEKGGRAFGSRKTDDEGKAVFALYEAGVYNITASKDGYVPNDGNSVDTADYAQGDDAEVQIELEKCTGESCNIVRIRVVDEDGLAVQNAKVSLSDDETGFIRGEHGYRLTDLNGYTEPAFGNVKDGAYYASAYKYPASGKSDSFDVEGMETELTMVLQIGYGTVRARVVDEDSREVALAKISFFQDGGTKLGELLTGNNGTAENEVRADKRIYIRAEAEGFLPYTTISREIIPELTTEFEIRLVKEIPQGKPEVSFDRLYSVDNYSEAATLNAGSAYYARFRVTLPRDDYSEAGIFIRAGEKGNVEEDMVFFREINAPAASVMKGTTYTPQTGGNYDMQNLTLSRAKWASAVWGSNPEAGIYEVEAEIVVRDGCPQDYSLPLYYRAYAVAPEGYERAPDDPVLGNAASVSTKGGLYAEAYKEFYKEGAEALCGTDFCFGTELLDMDENLYMPVQENYSLRNYGSYRVYFSFANAGNEAYRDAELEISSFGDEGDVSEVLQADEYVFVDADNERKVIKGPVYGNVSFGLGNFEKYAVTDGSITLKPRAAGAAGLRFRMISENTVVYEESLNFTVTAAGDLNISVTPEVIPAFVQEKLEVEVRHLEERLHGGPVEGAAAEVEISGIGLRQRLFARTGIRGIAEFELPVLMPGTRVTARVFKQGYPSFSVTRTVSDIIVEAEPEALEFELNLTESRLDEKELLLRKVIAPPVKIEKVSFLPYTRGVIDEDRANSWLATYTGTVMEGLGETVSFRIPASLTAESSLLAEPVVIRGRVIIYFSPEGTGESLWWSAVPFEATVNLAEMPDNAPCVILSEATWETSTMRNLAEKRFYIRNNCVTKNNEPLELRNLQAKIEWKGDAGITGNTELTVIDPLTGQAGTGVLQSGIWTTLLPRLETGMDYTAVLSFIPRADAVGKTAEFDVFVDAELVTNLGRQGVGAKPDRISSSIKIVNLEDCVKVNPESRKEVFIGPDEDRTEFTVDVSECGPMDMDIRFCGGSGGDSCRGGTSFGGLNIRPWEIEGLNGKDDYERTVTVSRSSVPGFYGIDVEARPAGASWRKVATIEALAEPEEGEYLSLGKYDFTVMGEGSTDSTMLINRMLVENVKVTASVCDWEEMDEEFMTSEDHMMAVFYNCVGLSKYSKNTKEWLMECNPVVSPFLNLYHLFKGLFGTGEEDPCKEKETATLKDYVINLTGNVMNGGSLLPDAHSVSVSDRRISGSYVLEVNDITAGEGGHGRQEVGLVFRNRGITEEDSVYAIVTVAAEEHIHGDITHENASTSCRNSKFGPYKIGSGSCINITSQEYKQPFHVRFRTGESEKLIPEAGFEGLPCVTETGHGITGKSALPKIKLDWSWAGIEWDSCDADNPDYFYCDATQFTIALNRRMKMLYDFLQANDFELGELDNSIYAAVAEEEVQQSNDVNASREVASGMLGLKSIVASAEELASGGGWKISARVKAENRTGFAQDASVTVSLSGVSEPAMVCVKELAGIVNEAEVVCEFTAGSSRYYGVTASLESATTDLTEEPVLTALLEPLKRRSEVQAICGSKTTALKHARPCIDYFIETNSDRVRWTVDIPDMATLDKILNFSAYLMKDGYTEDFAADFADYYTTQSFSDAPVYFSDLAAAADGTRYGFSSLLTGKNLRFRRKYIEGSELPAAGLYSVEVAADFGADDWRFFDEAGRPKVQAEVIFVLLDTPYAESPFYSLPLDGMLGYEADGTLDRQGYGVGYLEEAAGDTVHVDNSVQAVRSLPSGNSNPVSLLNVRKERSFYRLNTSLESKGSVLLVEKKDAWEGSLVFSPSAATPVAMRVSRAEGRDKSFSAFYGVVSGGTPVNIGNTLNYWSGTGRCLDFSGVPVAEAFGTKPDRAATKADGLNYWEFSYGLDWGEAAYTGDVYLRSIFYTPQEEDMVLVARKPANSVLFYTPDSTEETISLKGISGMPYNNPSAQIESVRDVFALVEAGDVCITNTGRKTLFWWNPEVLYSAEGMQRSIRGLAEGLEAGENCIGYSS
jgi:hypothetical protein